MLMVKYLADTDKNPAFRVAEMSSEDFLLVLVHPPTHTAHKTWWLFTITYFVAKMFLALKRILCIYPSGLESLCLFLCMCWCCNIPVLLQNAYNIKHTTNTYTSKVFTDQIQQEKKWYHFTMRSPFVNALTNIT